ncbi:hypothetical protein A3D05_02990 [Candidatus Gottesmanbacteria bacterium RIFCSPHIGHO2_02_FULL_40_24]|nr:MAG: hypothetical protein A3D05_02990 [Candidatus Gottesmanbacteria bacterium RIFCSPHIGHO2_02_FULL_40_24]OGG25955.1 MAG: hypothetical protein A3E42_02980 [Candidatus Gottesmanbacteria bacterium RIFCSPHIGHO2_12_FULL_40_13]
MIRVTNPKVEKELTFPGPGNAHITGPFPDELQKLHRVVKKLKHPVKPVAFEKAEEPEITEIGDVQVFPPRDLPEPMAGRRSG